MDDISIPTGETTRIVVMARDSGGAGATAATLNLAIRRNADGYWWNGSTFQSAHTTVAMTETDSTNLAGIYHLDFSSQVAFSGVVYITTATAGVTNDPFAATILVGSFLDNLDDEISGAATSAQVQTVLSRLGGTFLDNEWLRVHSLLREILNNQKALFKSIK